MKYIYLDIETTGLMPWYDSRITCICAKTTQGDTFEEVGGTEADLIRKFVTWLKMRSNTDYEIITKNGKQFDIPFILTRSVKGNIDYNIVSFILEYEHFDMQLVTTKWISLGDWAKIYRLPINKTANGFQAIIMWDERRYADLLDYCKQDVLVLEQIHQMYSKLNGCNQ